MPLQGNSPAKPFRHCAVPRVESPTHTAKSRVAVSPSGSLAPTLTVARPGPTASISTWVPVASETVTANR